MKNAKSRLIGIALAGTLGLGGALAMAPAANAVNMVECGNRTDFLKLERYSGPPLCFANKGIVFIPVEQREFISRILTGNNNVKVTVGNSGSFTLSKWATHNVPQGTLTIAVEIL